VNWEKCFGTCHNNTLCWSTAAEIEEHEVINPLKRNNLKEHCTTQLTSRCCILNIYSTNIPTEYFKHAA